MAYILHKMMNKKNLRMSYAWLWMGGIRDEFPLTVHKYGCDTHGYVHCVLSIFACLDNPTLRIFL